MAAVAQFNLGYSEVEQPPDRGLIKSFCTVQKHLTTLKASNSLV